MPVCWQQHISSSSHNMQRKRVQWQQCVMSLCVIDSIVMTAAWLLAATA
jgi:hypothetical protein